MEVAVPGLLNLGNTCYLNATLQAIASSEALSNHLAECAKLLQSSQQQQQQEASPSALSRVLSLAKSAWRFLIQGPDDAPFSTAELTAQAAKGHLTQQLHCLLTALQPLMVNPNTPQPSLLAAVNPKPLLAALAWHVPQGVLELGEQHDAAEVLEALCNAVITEMTCWQELHSSLHTPGGLQQLLPLEQRKQLPAAAAGQPCRCLEQQHHCELQKEGYAQLQEHLLQRWQQQQEGLRCSHAVQDSQDWQPCSCTTSQQPCDTLLLQCQQAMHNISQQQQQWSQQGQHGQYQQKPWLSGLQQQSQQQQPERRSPCFEQSPQQEQQHHPSNIQGAAKCTRLPVIGHCVDCITCLTCGHRFTRTLNPFVCLVLPLPSLWRSSGRLCVKQGTDLLDCLHAYSQSEVVEGVECLGCSLKACLAAAAAAAAGTAAKPVATSAMFKAANGAAVASVIPSAVADDVTTAAPNSMISEDAAQQQEKQQAVHMLKVEQLHQQASKPMGIQHNGQQHYQQHQQMEALPSPAANGTCLLLELDNLAKLSTPLPPLDYQQLVQQELKLPWLRAKRAVTKSTQLARAPQVLLLQLQRSVHVGGSYAKVQGHVRFPVMLDLADHVWVDEQRQQPQRQQTQLEQPKAALYFEGKQECQQQQQQLGQLELSHLPELPSGQQCHDWEQQPQEQQRRRRRRQELGQMQVLAHNYQGHLQQRQQHTEQHAQQQQHHIDQAVQEDALPHDGQSASMSVHCFKCQGQCQQQALQPGQQASASPAQPDLQKQLQYRLVSVIQHLGAGHSSGHYIMYRQAQLCADIYLQQHQAVAEDFVAPQICYVQSHNKPLWFRVSDSSVRKVTEQEVMACDATLLVYERCNVHTGISD